MERLEEQTDMSAPVPVSTTEVFDTNFFDTDTILILCRVKNSILILILILSRSKLSILILIPILAMSKIRYRY